MVCPSLSQLWRIVWVSALVQTLICTLCLVGSSQACSIAEHCCVEVIFPWFKRVETEVFLQLMLKEGVLVILKPLFRAGLCLGVHQGRSLLYTLFLQVFGDEGHAGDLAQLPFLGVGTGCLGFIACIEWRSLCVDCNHVDSSRWVFAHAELLEVTRAVVTRNVLLAALARVVVLWGVLGQMLVSRVAVKVELARQWKSRRHGLLLHVGSAWHAQCWSIWLSWLHHVRVFAFLLYQGLMID